MTTNAETARRYRAHRMAERLEGIERPFDLDDCRRLNDFLLHLPTGAGRRLDVRWVDIDDLPDAYADEHPAGLYALHRSVSVLDGTHWGMVLVYANADLLAVCRRAIEEAGVTVL